METDVCVCMCERADHIGGQGSCRNCSCLRFESKPDAEIKTGLEIMEEKQFAEFKQLWYNTLSSVLWCEVYAHPLHRSCVVVLGYESLPEPFRVMAGEIEHLGVTGERVMATPEICYKCEKNIRNGGNCDPL